ncbi:alpha/beta hydrolase [Aeromicrobium sp. CF4.19]|uniref:alpha/beta hydrolase n=1 Tax=Aeromicrobium sp. CF4.19 TaxID=3373082 RepID=UPI003EE63741
MDVSPRLIPVTVPTRPEGVALVLHGGGSRGEAMMVSPTQLSVLRMVPIARRLARVGRGRLAVYRLLNSVRGWDSTHTPVKDAQWALGQVRDDLGTDLPATLVGHSLGGRAALLAADHPAVDSVVALNPYLYPADGATDLKARRILIVHGTADRIAPLTNAEFVARDLSRSADVGLVRVSGGKHAMLSRSSTFTGLATDFVRWHRLGAEATSPLADAMGARQGIDV